MNHRRDKSKVDLTVDSQRWRLFSSREQKTDDHPRLPLASKSKVYLTTDETFQKTMLATHEHPHLR